MPWTRTSWRLLYYGICTFEFFKAWQREDFASMIFCFLAGMGWTLAFTWEDTARRLYEKLASDRPN